MDKALAMIRGVALAVPLALALGMTAMITAGPANAETVEECQAAIAAVGSELNDVVFLGQGPDEQKIRDKLDEASFKLNQAKFDDAIQKLEDARQKIEQLRDAPKPKIADATPDDGNDDIQDVLDAIDAAIACIDALALQSM